MPDQLRRFTSFSPAELARIAGIPPEVQRVWRARGHMPKGDGSYSQYDPPLVASLMVRKALTTFGIGHSELNGLSYSAARHVVWWALLDVEGAVSVTAPNGHPVPARAELSVPILAGRLLNLKPGEAYQFIARADEEAVVLRKEVQMLFDGRSSGFFVDLRAIGRQLAQRAGRPLLEVVVGKMETISDAQPPRT